MTEGTIEQVNREDKIFRNRIVKVIFGSGKEERVAVPNNEIICDVCGKEIKTEKVNVLKFGTYVWGALCDECARGWHKDG